MQTKNLKITWLRSTMEERETLAKVDEASWNLFLVGPKDSQKVPPSGRFTGKFEALELQRLIDVAG